MGDTASELIVSCSQVRLPVAGLCFIVLRCWPTSPIERNSQQFRLMLGQSIVLKNKSWDSLAKDNTTQLNMEKSSWSLHGALTPTM